MSDTRDVEIPPPEPPETQHWGRTLIYDGLAQTNLDMDHHQLLNLDTSNLPISAAPPTINLPANQWLHGWNNSTRVWTATQPDFAHLSGNLLYDQQRQITALGTIGIGIWQASVIAGQYLPTLDLIRSPVNNLSVANKRIVNLADPVNPQDAVSRHFMDFLLQGLVPKESVRCASNSQRGHVGLQPPVDGVTLLDGDRVLLRKQSAGHELENTIWIARSGAWDLPPDADTFDELNRAYVTVREGALNAGTSWVQVLAQTAANQPRNWVLFSTAGGEPGPPGANGQGVPIGGTINQVLAKAGPEDYNTHWVNPSSGFGGNPPVYAYLQTVPTGNIPPPPDPTLIGKMAGLAGYITPSASGKLAATIAGFLWNTSPGGQASLRMCVGAGTAPVNGANKPPPEQCLTVGAVIASFEGGAAHAVPFSVTDVIALAAGTRYWYDLFLVPVTVGTIGVSGVSISVSEIP